MSFLVELANRLRTHFARANHLHDANYEPKNTNIQQHVGAVGNPHGTTKSDLGLANVTNDAQIKKSPSSVNGNVPVWQGTNGDALGGGYPVETSLAGGSNTLATSSAVKTYIDNATVGTGAGLVPGGTQSITTLKAINTTDANVFPDRALINVEDAGLFRLDRQSNATGDDNQIVSPTVGVGRWFKMSSHINSHQLLIELLGGAAGEYYHLTLDQHGALPSGISSANRLVSDGHAKLSKLLNDGMFPVNQIHVTSAEWTAFTNALNS